MNLNNKINTYNIDPDAKEFIINRTNTTFKEQFIFYYDMTNDYDRAFIRATEETLLINEEERMHFCQNLLNTINDNNIEPNEKLNILRNELR